MAGLLTYATGGIGLFLIGASETFISTSQSLNQISNQTSLSPQTTSTSTSTKTTLNKSNIKSLIFTIISLLSVLFILNSFISLTDAVKSHDQTGVVLQLEVVSICVVFLLFSVLGLLTNYGKVYVPVKMMDVLCLFGFVEEFYMFYIQKKDGDGIENRYYDLLLVPILVCIVSTLLELGREKSDQVVYYSRLGRGVGLVMQGMWFLQMGVSFYSSGITHGCFMKGKSRGNFTIRCKGHPEFHRARAVATLQFNCHLALMVCFVCGVYSLLSRKYGVSNESLMYKPLGDEMQQRLDQGRFTLDSDEEEDVKDAAENVVVEKSVGGASEMVVVNGYGSHH